MKQLKYLTTDNSDKQLLKIIAMGVLSSGKPTGQGKMGTAAFIGMEAKQSSAKRAGSGRDLGETPPGKASSWEAGAGLGTSLNILPGPPPPEGPVTRSCHKKLK